MLQLLFHCGSDLGRSSEPVALAVVLPVGPFRTPISSVGSAALPKSWQIQGRHVEGMFVVCCFKDVIMFLY